MTENRYTRTTHWYLLRTKYNQESKAAKELQQQGIDVFLPIHKVEKIIKSKKTIKKEPLFSRYIFVQLDFEKINWTSIRSTRGVSNYVEFGRGPAIVAQAIIEELEKIDSLAPKPYYKIGQKLRIRSGALKGLKAIYDAPDGTSRSYLLLTFMQQNQRVSIDNQRLKKL